MDMGSTENIMIEIDKCLALISVRGDDAYHMVRARNLIKAAYERLAREKEVAQHESAE